MLDIFLALIVAKKCTLYDRIGVAGRADIVRWNELEVFAEPLDFGNRILHPQHEMTDARTGVASGR